MISEEQLQAWEGLAQYRKDRKLSIDPILVIELIAELRGLQKCLHAVSDTNNKLEKEADWLAGFLGATAHCTRLYSNCDMTQTKAEDCKKCWIKAASKATESE